MPFRHTAARRARLPETLLQTCLALGSSGSRVEDRYWEVQLRTPLERMLNQRNDDALESLLQTIMQKAQPAYDRLLELLESLVESREHDGQQSLLWIAPIAAWTRFRLPDGPLKPSLQAGLEAALVEQVFAPGVRVRMIPHLLAVEHMPHGFGETWHWLQQLSQSAGADKLKAPVDTQAEVMSLMADCRYLCGVVQAPLGEPLFRWQLPENLPHGRESVAQTWVEAVRPLLADTFSACVFEPLCPDAWFTGHREADLALRPMGVQSSVVFLESALNWAPSDIRAVVALCGEQQPEEFRVGLTKRGSNDVVHGVVWPLLREAADPEGAGLEALMQCLQACGIREIRRIPDQLPMEFCEDCGAPYFPDPTGAMVHAELPEDAQPEPPAYH